jgi:hypothetical protein
MDFPFESFLNEWLCVIKWWGVKKFCHVTKNNVPPILRNVWCAFGFPDVLQQHPTSHKDL